MIAAMFRDDVEGSGVVTVEDLKFLEPADLNDMRLVGLDVRSCERLAAWQAYLVQRSTQETPSDDTAVLMDFYQRVQPEYATMHKVEKVIKSYKKKAKKNAATAAANGDAPPHGWQALMYGDYKKQKGVDPRDCWGGTLLGVSLELCGVYHTSAAPETITPVARAFFQRQEQAEIVAKQQQRNSVQSDTSVGAGEMSPVAERMARLQKQAAEQAATVKVQEAEERAKKNAELLDARIRREAYQDDQRKAGLAKRKAAEHAAAQKRVQADKERAERDRAEQERTAALKRAEDRRVAHIATTRRELFVQLEKHEVTQSLLAARAAAPAHEEALRVEAALEALRVQEGADTEKMEGLEVRLAEIVESEKYRAEEKAGEMARAESAAELAASPSGLASSRGPDAASAAGGSFSRIQTASYASSPNAVAERLSAQRRQQQAAAAEAQRAKEAAEWSDRTTRELERMEKEQRWSRRALAAEAEAEALPDDKRERERLEYLQHCG
jgi:hypothetical protein